MLYSAAHAFIKAKTNLWLLNLNRHYGIALWFATRVGSISQIKTGKKVTALDVIELFAGTRPDGTPVVERLQVRGLEDESLQLVKSPAFIQGIASGDVIKLNREDQSFELLKRAGNLCIRVFAKNDIEQLAQDLTPILEKMGGELDFENERMLVYTIHVSCGFAATEQQLNDHVGEDSDSIWFYGNVYDPKDGQTPLNWWQEILAPQ
ncbi:MAG: hypothetical protein ACI9Y1_002706 [Lentisphaeria bacterium]|jgi:hypothetical protein